MLRVVAAFSVSIALIGCASLPMGDPDVLPAVLAVSAESQAVTVVSEDFSSGNPVAGTAYALVPAGSFSQPGQYRVLANPATAFTNGYRSYHDHTLGTAAGAMLFFDGASHPLALWSEGVMLSAGTQYTFSFWASAGGAISVPVVGLRLDGVNVGQSVTTSVASWRRFTYSFVPRTTGLRIFTIVDLNLQRMGNDGAIDDILLTAVPVVPQ
jgi:hypothetical protein